MRINLLHTCRQIYLEAWFIPYSTNTFSFDTARNLRAFVHLLIQRKVDVNQAIRYLQVDLSHMNHNLHAWTQAFNVVMRHMTQLEEVYVNVDQRFKCSSRKSDACREMHMKPVLNCLVILGKTSARPIEIIVSNRYLSSLLDGDFTLDIWDSSDSSDYDTWTMYRWTVEEQRQWVEKVKLAIRDGQTSTWNKDKRRGIRLNETVVQM